MQAALPTEVVNHIIWYGLTSSDLCAVSATSSRGLLHLNDENWRACVSNAWGHVQLPGVRSKTGITEWKRASAHLDRVVRPILQKSVAKAMRQLEVDGFFGDTMDDTAKITSLRRFLDAGDINMRRRVAAYVCSGKHKTSFIKCFLDDVDWLKANKFVRQSDSALAVECAFRYLLLKFPFLPIDAGVGADRVINAFTQVLLKNSAENFGRTQGCEALLLNRTDNDETSSSGASLQPMTTKSAFAKPTNTPCLIPEIPPDEQRDAVYILVYSLIMLNTDLHNPAINPKIKADQFVRSCKQTVLRSIPESMLIQMYHHIRCDPLRIANRSMSIHTTVKSGDEEDFIMPARYSRYSELNMQSGFWQIYVLPWLPVVPYEVVPDLSFLWEFFFPRPGASWSFPIIFCALLLLWSAGCVLAGTMSC